MTILSFNFKKISAERGAAPKGKISINNNISIKSVKGIDLNFGKTKNRGLRFNFSFETKFNPEFGKIVLEGELVYMTAPEDISKIEADWKKNKKLPKAVAQKIMAHIIDKANIEAIILSRTVSLPSPVPLPKIKAK